MTLLYGWCTTNQHDTPQGRGPCPIRIGDAPACRCPCHHGEDEARGILSAGTAGRAPDLGVAAVLGSTTEEPEREPEDPSPAESNPADPDGDGTPAGEAPAAASEAPDSDPAASAPHAAAEAIASPDDAGTLDLDGIPATASPDSTPEDPAEPPAAPKPRTKTKVAKPAFTRRMLHPGTAARTHSTPDGMFTAYLVLDENPEVGWYIALPRTHVRFRKGKAVTLETRAGAFSGWQIGGRWVDRRTDHEMTTTQDPLFDTDTEADIEGRVARMPQWAQEHMEALLGEKGQRQQRWWFELPVVELAVRLHQAGDVCAEEVVHYIEQWQPTLFQQAMARRLAEAQEGAGEAFPDVRFS